MSAARARSRRAITCASLILLTLVSVVVGGCGKVGPPLPPLPRSVPRANQVAVTQVGGVVRISWLAPRLDLRESEDGSVLRADVYRLVQSRNEPKVAFPDIFENGADIIGFLDYETLVKQLKAGDTLTFEDTLDLTTSSELANSRFIYAIRYVDRRERKQPLSNLVAIEPVPGIALPPTDLATTETQDSITLTWKAPEANIDGSRPAQVVGYNVYRAKGNGEILGRPLNDDPITEMKFVDRNFIYLTPYGYVVRSVSQTTKSTVESVDSARLKVTPKDVFAPSAPTSVTAASASGIVSVFWPANPERDVAGYYVYRAEGDPAGSFERITPSLETKTTYRDERVRIGVRYSYKVSAVDRYGNESPASSVVVETAYQ